VRWEVATARHEWAIPSAQWRQDCSMTSDEFAVLADLSIDALNDVADADWTTRAGVLEWNCWQTADHMVDCVFSYAMQIGARAQSGYLPFEELHAKPEATTWGREFTDADGGPARLPAQLWCSPMPSVASRMGGQTVLPVRPSAPEHARPSTGFSAVFLVAPI
jgi:hypothetical protein